ncbi:MAG: hypothetical protein GY906_10415 [bacterium]|nr:hypothetical protein [bacterium]
MADIRDELQLDVSQALAAIREVENALNRALADVEVDVETGPGVQQLSEEFDQAADQAARIERELEQADEAAAGLASEMRQVEDSTDAAADEARRLARETDDAESSASRLSGSLKGIAIGVAAAVGAREIAQFLGDAVNAATDLNESINAVNVVFGEASEKVLAFGQDTSDAVFLAASEFNALATSTGNLLQGFGLAADDAADITIELTNRAADLASVFNTEVADALAAINGAIRGEAEAIRRFTGSFSIDEVKRFGQELFGVTGELTDQQKALATVELILEKTAAVQGDAANTAGELANQQRALTEAWTNAQAVIGNALVPALTELVPLLVSLAGVIPTIVKSASDLFTVSEGLVGSLVNVGQAAVAVAQLDFTQAGNQIGDAADSAFRFADTLFGSRSILRDFQSILADGVDNTTDYANALQTVADEDDLIRLFEEITEAAAAGGVGIEAQASALRTLVTEGRLSAQETRFLKDRFIELAQQLDRTDLIGEDTIFTFSTLGGIFDSLGTSVSSYVSEAQAAEALDLASSQEAAMAPVEAMIEFYEQEADAVVAAAEAQQELNDAIAELPETASTVGEAIGLAKDEILEFGLGIEAATIAADEFRSKTLELTDPVFAAAEAQERLTTAEEKLAEARESGEASAQEIANLTLDVASAALEADATLRGLGDVNLQGGAFDRSLGILAEVLGTTREDVLLLLEDAEILNNTEIGPTVEFLVDDDELEAALLGIPDTITVGVQLASVGGTPVLPGAAPGPDLADPRTISGGVQESPDVSVVIINPTDSDIAGNAAQAGNTVATIVAATGAYRGR